MTNILKQICLDKKHLVAEEKELKSFEIIKKEAEGITTESNFQESLYTKINNKEIAIIAEIKRKSPSHGILNHNFNIKNIAENYKKGGATCISVLTDYKYFAGKNEYINIVKTISGLPILRKDFIIDPYQIYQAKTIGSDAILLIMSCLSMDQAKEFEDIASSIGLDILVETHNEDEIAKALELNTKLIGINNRNLKTLDISLNNIKNLAELIPNNKIIICESGINSKKDLDMITNLDIYGFLIGGYLMKGEEHISDRLSDLLTQR